jgi:hypothetical protein
MKQIQVTEIGRSARELMRYPVLAGRDAHALLASEIEFYWQEGAIVSPVVGECDSFVVLRKPSLIGGKRVIKVRIVEVGIGDEDTNEISTVELSK